MTRRILVSILVCSLALATSQSVCGQDKKTVAVVPATGDAVGEEIRNGITEGLQEGVFNSGSYRLLARSSAFEKAFSEMKFQQGGAVADNQLTQFGNALGANFVCYATVSKYSANDYRISYKMIDVATGEIVNMGSETVRDGASGLLTATDNIARKLFVGGSVGVSGTSIGMSGAARSDSSGQNQTISVNGVSFEMVYVQGGSFTMASLGQTYTLLDFYIGKYEVTQAQWKAVMDGKNPSDWKGDNLPVEMVSWDDAQEFIARLNHATGRKYALPTEAQWEFAARGGTKSQNYEYSGSNSVNNVAWYSGNSGNRTQPVGTKLPNELGIYDMSGNVWEWCEDWYNSSKSDRVNRGGSWFSAAGSCRSAFRGNLTPSSRNYGMGFRVVLVP